MARPSAKGRGLAHPDLTPILRTPSRGLGSQVTVVKSAVACSLAYAIAVAVGPPRYAALAPVVAVFTVQGSVLGTLSQGVQRVLGTALGVALAAVWVQQVETTWWSVLIAMLVTIELARRLPIGFSGQAQIPVSVLLTIALGPTSQAYGQWRVADSLIGGAVGILIGVVVPERPPFTAAREAQHEWGDGVDDQLDAIATELEQPPRDLGDNRRHDFIDGSRALYDTALAGRTATALAGEGVWFNPRGRRHRDQFALLELRERDLVRLTLEVRVLALTVDQLYDRPHVHPTLDRLTLAGLLHDLAALHRGARAGDDTLPASLVLRATIAQAVADVTAERADAYSVLDSVSLLGRLEQLRRELTGVDPLGAPGGDPVDEAAELPDPDR